MAKGDCKTKNNCCKKPKRCGKALNNQTGNYVDKKSKAYEELVLMGYIFDPEMYNYLMGLCGCSACSAYQDFPDYYYPYMYYNNNAGCKTCK